LPCTGGYGPRPVLGRLPRGRGALGDPQGGGRFARRRRRAGGVVAAPAGRGCPVSKPTACSDERRKRAQRLAEPSRNGEAWPDPILFGDHPEPPAFPVKLLPPWQER